MVNNDEAGGSGQAPLGEAPVGKPPLGGHPVDPVRASRPLDEAPVGKPPVDPVRVSRARWARWGAAGKRVGYALVLVAIIVFVMGAITGFTGPVTVVVTACLFGSTITLAPGLVIGYGVRKAEREDPLPGRG